MIVAIGEDILLVQAGNRAESSQGGHSPYAELAYREARHQRKLGTIHPGVIINGPGGIGAAQGSPESVQQSREKTRFSDTVTN